MSIVAAFVMPHPPIILPEIGKGQEKIIQKTINACNEVAKEIADIKPETIILTSPHAIVYSDYFHISSGNGGSGNFENFGAIGRSINVNYDEEFVDALEKEAYRENIKAGKLGGKDRSLDHGTMLPLTFINDEYTDYKLVRISISGLSKEEHYKLGLAISKVADRLNKKVVFIASGDLSHKLKEDGPYGISKEGPLFDKEIMSIFEKGDLTKLMDFDMVFCNNAAECGLPSFIIMAGALDGKKFDSRVLSYEGPFGVGYGVAAFKTIEEV